MENVYTCVCGNQTWIIEENGVRCASCKALYEAARHMPVKDFNRLVLEEIEETEEVL